MSITATKNDAGTVTIPETMGSALISAAGAFIEQAGFLAIGHANVGEYVLSCRFPVADGGGGGLIPLGLVCQATILQVPGVPGKVGVLRCTRTNADEITVNVYELLQGAWAPVDADFWLTVAKYA